MLGVDLSFGNFTIHNDTVMTAFGAHLDGLFPTQYYLTALLERGVRVLLYAGVNDYLCNWVHSFHVRSASHLTGYYIGNERMSLALEWTGRQRFASQPLREWSVDGNVAGLARSANGLTFVTVNDAGHMVQFLYSICLHIVVSSFSQGPL